MGGKFGYDGYQWHAIIARDLLAWFSAAATGAPVFSNTRVPACTYFYILIMDEKVLVLFVFTFVPKGE